jgi:hypothetical protein
MQLRTKAIAACILGLALASCAPKPEPIVPEVIYDKYGEAIVNECRPSTIPVSPNYPERLPICDERCPPGTMPNPNATVAAPTLPQCVPIPDDDDDNPQRGQTIN